MDTDGLESLRKRKPWTWGPLELIRHAEGHRITDSDTDRRLALIGFDNAVEVCIHVFVNSHPRLRGVELSKEDVKKANANFHTKVGFLDDHVRNQGLELGTPVEVLVWLHTIRNELYHSGNGMLPERHVVEDARTAAIEVFAALFGEDIRPLLDDPVAEPHPPVSYHDEDNPTHVVFLSLFLWAEKAIAALLDADAPRDPVARWEATLEVAPEAGRHDETYRAALSARDLLVHWGAVDDEETLDALSAGLNDLVEELERAASEAHGSTS